MNLDKLLTPGPPAYYWCNLTFPELKKALGPTNLMLFSLDCEKMRDIPGVYSEFFDVLSFPDYFGWNGNAFHECLNDLEWLGDPDGYVLYFAKPDLLLRDGDFEDIAWLMRMLHFACEEWGIEIRDGELWDRPPRSFHSCFGSEESTENMYSFNLDFV